MAGAVSGRIPDGRAMLVHTYIEAILIDAEQADAVWQRWYDVAISDDEAEQEWREIASE